MQRTVTGWHIDDVGDWVAELSCLHGQHVRHRPPFRFAPWVVTEDGRRAHVGVELDCPLCDRAELPEGLSVLRTTDTWTADTVPKGLLRRHRVAAQRWGLLRVLDGQTRFWAATNPEIDRLVVAGGSQPIPPELDHHIVLVGPVQLCVDFYGRASVS